jgi:hypothetical protein
MIRMIRMVRARGQEMKKIGKMKKIAGVQNMKRNWIRRMKPYIKISLRAYGNEMKLMRAIRHSIVSFGRNTHIKNPTQRKTDKSNTKFVNVTSVIALRITGQYLAQYLHPKFVVIAIT